MSADGKNHHVCVTWNLATGPLKVYVDGKLGRTEQRKTSCVPTGGTWILGQDQDAFEGGYSKENSMKGILADVHIWNRILDPLEIEGLALGCNPVITGNVKSPKDFKIRGGVEKFKPIYCLGS